MPRNWSIPALCAASFALAIGALAASASATENQSFSIVIRNVSNDRTLQVSPSETRAVPVAPGAYAVVTDRSTVFRQGEPAGSYELEMLAEDGNAEAVIAFLKEQPDVRQAGLFIPGQAFTVNAMPGDRLVFAAMFVESNDLFYAPGPEGIALFDDSANALSGDITSQVVLWDAGTEINEQPGVGSNQAPRQTGPNTGPTENGVVRPVNDGFDYPAIGEVLEVTLSKE